NPANLRVSDHVTINRSCYFDLNAIIVLGEYVGIGHGATFITTVHQVVPGMEFGVGIIGKSISVKDRAWIGANVTVMPGVDIGTDAIVSVGTILMRDVPSHSVVAGSPGRVVRRNVRQWDPASVDDEVQTSSDVITSTFPDQR